MAGDFYRLQTDKSPQSILVFLHSCTVFSSPCLCVSVVNRVFSSSSLGKLILNAFDQSLGGILKRYHVAAVSDVPPGAGREFVVGGRIVALFNTDGAYYALDGICPHAGGPIAKGTLCGAVVTCPWHGWQFDVTSGRHCLNPQLKQPGFPVVIEGDQLWVELPTE